MPHIQTRTVVAGVAHQQAVWYRAIRQLPRKPMCQYAAPWSRDSQLAVAVRRDCTAPFATARRHQFGTLFEASAQRLRVVLVDCYGRNTDAGTQQRCRRRGLTLMPACCVAQFWKIEIHGREVAGDAQPPPAPCSAALAALAALALTAFAFAAFHRCSPSRYTGVTAAPARHQAVKRIISSTTRSRSARV